MSDEEEIYQVRVRRCLFSGVASPYVVLVWHIIGVAQPPRLFGS